MGYEAGELSPQHYPVVVGQANFMTPLAIETWCIENCDGPWHLDTPDDETVNLSFAQDDDITLFYLSRYSRHIRR